jgi:hypothetical protein
MEMLTLFMLLMAVWATILTYKIRSQKHQNQVLRHSNKIKSIEIERLKTQLYGKEGETGQAETEER